MITNELNFIALEIVVEKSLKSFLEKVNSLLSDGFVFATRVNYQFMRENEMFFQVEMVKPEQKKKRGPKPGSKRKTAEKKDTGKTATAKKKSTRKKKS